MDAIIQSLTQSAIVQKLSDTENNVKRFTHDIPDNAPYRSLNKVEIPPYSGSTNPDASVRFKIPRRGYLNRMYLKVHCNFSNSAESIEADFGERPQGPEFFAGFFKSAELYVGGKHIETLYAENVLYDAFRNDKSSSETILYWLKGSHSNYEENEIGEYFFDHDFTAPTPNLPTSANFYIPLNFSLFSFYKDSPDTTFLPTMELVFNKGAVKAQQVVGASFTSASLVCKYHNVLNHFKTQIRNTNYPKDTTTLLTSNNYLVNVLPKITQVSAVPDQSNPYVPGSPAFGRNVYNLDLDLYATDILITFRKLDVLQANFYTSEIYCNPHEDDDGDTAYLKFILKANGRVLFEKHHWEMHHEQNVSANDIQDQANMHQGLTFYGGVGSQYERYAGTLFNDEATTAEYRTSPCMYRIPLTLFGTDEFLNGGLDMKSLKNVELCIEGSGLVFPETTTSDHNGLTPQIVIRHKTLTRIDGKTGSVSLV